MTASIKSIYIFFLTLLIFCAQNSTGQKTIDNSYIENVFLSTDRDLYLTEEKIWFFASVNSSLDTLLSDVLYIELFNQDKSQIIKKKYLIDNSGVNGFIEIPSNFKTDGYLFSAYTRYQRNYLPDQFAYQLLTIVNPQYGVPVNKNKKKEAKFDPDNFVQYSDTTGMAYIGSLQEKSRSMIEQMNIERSENDNLRLNIKLKEPQKLTLYLKNNDLSPAYKKSTFTSVQQELFDIPAKNLSKGLTYCFLTAGEKPIALGLVYRGGETKKVSVSGQKQIFTPGEEVLLDIKQIKRGMPATVCISVVKKGLKNSHRDTSCLFSNLKTNPLLINNFHNSYPGIHVPQDVLAETLQKHCNRIINHDSFIKKITNNSDIRLKIPPEIRKVNISGLICDNQNIPLPETTCYLSVLGEKPRFLMTKTNEKGEFLFSLENSTGVRNLFIKTANSGKEPEICVNQDFSNEMNGSLYLSPVISEQDSSLLNDMLFIQHIKEKFNNNDAMILDSIPVLPFLTRYGNRVSLDNYIELPTVKEIFKEIIPFVAVKKVSGAYKLWVLDEHTKTYFKEPLVLLDNLPINDINELFKIHPKYLTDIYVINKIYYTGDYTIKGVIAIQTNTDNFAGFETPKSGVFVEYITLTPQANIMKTSGKNQHLPDFHNLVHWETGISIQDNYRTSFIAPDNYGQFEVIVKGNYLDNETCFGTFEFLVGKKK